MVAASAKTKAHAVISRWDGISMQSLAQALMSPATDCIEGNATGSPRTGRSTGRHLGLTVTTRSVYRHSIARVFAGALQGRIALSPDLHQRVHTALQEAMINAMLHGNLGLDASLRDDLQALTVSRAIIEARLASEQIARSLIRVDANWSGTMLYVVVRDNGSGFTKTDVPSEEERLDAGRTGSGRGLMILETLCDRISLLRGGTTIKLGFLLCGA